MNIKQLKSLIAEGESETLEFKTSTAQLKSACETLCAYLNGKGGKVLIGIRNNGEIIGQHVTDNTQQELARELSKVEPHANLEVMYLSIEANKQIIIITAESGKNLPYVYDDRPFLRNQSTTTRMPREKYERLLYEKKPLSVEWESLTSNDVTITDLDKKRIQQIVNLAIEEGRLTEIALRAEPKEILKKWNLTNNNKLKNAAVILFCKDESKQFIQSQLKLARFKGLTKSEFIDNKAVIGNLFDLYEQAMKFLQNHLPIAGKVEEGNLFRTDTLAIPYKVLREALVNALCHRSYSSPGGSVNLAIYDDRIEVSSTGRLPNDISLKELTKKHESHPRNPLIAKVLYDCKMIERWGRGTQDMINFCRAAGNPKPKFIEFTGSFTVMLPLKEPIGGYKKDKHLKVTQRQSEILKLLRRSALNGAQIAKKLKDSPTLRTVQVDLTHLEKLGLVKREGKARSILWHLIKTEE